MNILKKMVCILLGIIGIHTIQAEIITYPAEVTPGSWLCFRKDISVGKDASHNLLKIAADSKYWLWINGELIVREGNLKRGKRFGFREKHHCTFSLVFRERWV